MLTRIGKFAAAIVIAGGATLRATPAHADSWRFCTGEELTSACNSPPGNYQDINGDWWCGYYAGDCMAEDTETGTTLHWTVYYNYNGQEPCAIGLPC